MSKTFQIDLHNCFNDDTYTTYVNAESIKKISNYQVIINDDVKIHIPFIIDSIKVLNADILWDSDFDFEKTL